MPQRHMHHVIVLNSTDSWDHWLVVGTFLAIVAAIVIAIYQDSWRDWLRRSNITYIGRASHLQDHEKLGTGYKQIILRILLKNTGYEARNVQVDVIAIQEDSMDRANFLEVPLNWTHGNIYSPSGVVRNIQKNQTAYLDVCSGSTDYKTLSLSTSVGGNPDFRELKPGRTVLTLAMFQKSGQTLYLILEINWEKGRRPSLDYIKTDKAMEEIAFH